MVLAHSVALEDLLKSLRNHLARLTSELEQHKALVAELRLAQTQAQSALAHISPARPDSSVRKELVALRHEVERLGNEVHRLGGIVEEGLDTRRRARGERTVRMEEAEAARFRKETERDEREIARIKADIERRRRNEANHATHAPPPTPGPSKLRQGIHAAGAVAPGLMPSSEAPQRTAPAQATRRRSTSPTSDGGQVSPTPTAGSRTRSRPSRQARVEGPSSPFPSIRAEDEEDFFASLDETERPTPASNHPEIGVGRSPWSKKFKDATRRVSSDSAGSGSSKSSDGVVPPQTVLTRVIRELEADFAHYRA